jgi:hypothetical protein
MMNKPLYTEQVQSKITSGLFTGLTILFLALFAWRWSRVGWKFLPGLFLFLGLFFLFYVFNYQTLRITLNEDILLLQYGLVRWRTELKNIRSCDLDDPPWWIKYGGAGVHFAQVDGLYRAFFNILEGPRVLVIFKQKQGLVSALSFSTSNPDQILALLERRNTD